jgi:hypothetical protein
MLHDRIDSQITAVFADDREARIKSRAAILESIFCENVKEGFLEVFQIAFVQLNNCYQIGG